jgi:hypothetical protein
MNSALSETLSSPSSERNLLIHTFQRGKSEPTLADYLARIAKLDIEYFFEKAVILSRVPKFP